MIGNQCALKCRLQYMTMRPKLTLRLKSICFVFYHCRARLSLLIGLRYTKARVIGYSDCFRNVWIVVKYAMEKHCISLSLFLFSFFFFSFVFLSRTKCNASFRLKWMSFRPCSVFHPFLPSCVYLRYSCAMLY